MKVETMLYVYLAVCACMIVFNLICVFIFRHRTKSLEDHSEKMQKKINQQFELLLDGDHVEEKHCDYLRRKLRRSAGLLAFDKALEQLQNENKEITQSYLSEITAVFTYLVVGRQYRNVIKSTYLAYIIAKYRLIYGREVSLILNVMMQMLHESSIYCRENALQVIYSSADSDCVLHALRIVDNNPEFHHSKLLTDGLLTFEGDQRKLSLVLWNEFDKFSVSMRVVILDFIRFSGQIMHEEFLQLMADENQDDEIRFSCIRYFGKHPYERAYPLLLTFADINGSRRWEYSAIAVSSLASYPGVRTVDVLKRALNSSNWYTRFNASKSLERFHLSYVELSNVLDGNDRYAREILQYRLDLREAEKGLEVSV